MHDGTRIQDMLEDYGPIVFSDEVAARSFIRMHNQSYGTNILTITPEMLEALQNGEVVAFSIQYNEFAAVVELQQ